MSIQMKKNKNSSKKIKNICLPIRCIKRTLIYNGEIFDLYIIKDTIARTKGSKIIVAEEFFKELNKKEQMAVLYHERYHQKSLTPLKFVLNIIRFCSFRKARWQEEFDADNYAKNKVGKKDVISFLEKSKMRYEKGKTAYNKKSHPPIEERINNVRGND